MVSGSCQGKLVARQGPTHNTSLAELIPGGYEGRVEELAVSVGRGSGADGEEMRRCGSPPPPTPEKCHWTSQPVQMAYEMETPTPQVSWNGSQTDFFFKARIPSSHSAYPLGTLLTLEHSQGGYF